MIPPNRYYDRLFVEKTLSLDDSLVKEHFPVSVVVPTILGIYQNLLGVRFVEVTGDKKDVWHPGTGEWSLILPHTYSMVIHRGSTIRSLGKGCQGRNRLRRLLLPRPFPPRYVRAVLRKSQMLTPFDCSCKVFSCRCLGPSSRV